jgi:predicted dehydrogenase
MVHFQHMLRPSAVWLKKAICRGDLGRIRRVKGISLWWRSDEYYTRVAWSGKRIYKGQPTLDGAMSNQTIHFLNQMLAMGQRTGPGQIACHESMRSALYRFHSPSVLEMEDTAVVTGLLDNDDRTEFFFAGTTCAAEAELADRTKGYGRTSARQHVVTVEGDNGLATWDGTARLEIKGRPVETFDQPDGPWPFYFHLQNVLAGTEEPITPAEQAVKTMRFVFAAYDACPNGIATRDWSAHAGVAETLRQCHQDFCLPAELDNPPAWA